MRNSTFVRSVIGNSLIIDTSCVPRQGPRSVFLPQFPNVPASGLENAAEFHQPFWLGSAFTGSTPEMQFSRVAFVTKLVPPESQADTFTAPPLCIVVIVLACQPPTS